MKMIPQIIVLSVLFINLLIASNEHGKEKMVKGNFWIILIACIINMSILYWGGFFDVIFQY